LLNHFVPEDCEGEEVHHIRVRRQSEAPVHTPNDAEFTREVHSALEGFDTRKAPGEDALSSEILQHVFRSFPTTFTEIYKECLRREHFPKQWKRSMILPIVNQGKEGLNEVQKYRPISLIYIGGKILEKLLIEKINHPLNSKRLINENQYGFRPQRRTVDAAMAVKGFVQTHLQQRKVGITSLDVQGAFDAAWWPAILHNLRNLRVPQEFIHSDKKLFQ